VADSLYNVHINKLEGGRFFMKKKRPFVVDLLWCLLLPAGCAVNSQQAEETLVLEAERVITFSDGESANLWRTDHDGSAIYKLLDGTTLLTIQDTTSPDNVYVGGVESVDDLSESAQKAVSAFYEEQGLIYDTKSELQNSYTEYLTFKGSGTEYHDCHISQEYCPHSL